MPHSSGGGSFSGGSHGGSGSHRHGSSTPVHTIQTTYFVGATRYVYYGRGCPHYYYSDLKQSGKGYLKTAIMFCVGAALFLVFAVLLACFSRITPYKLEGAVDTNIKIEDNANVISDKSALLQTLNDFADKTGVVPAVVTVNNSAWRNYDNLEDYAYHLYLAEFDDEYHWLLVFSCDDGGSRWYWEGMQGDNTDVVLHWGLLENFNSTVQKRLEEGVSAGESFDAAFLKILPDCMEPYTEPALIAAAAIFAVIGVVVIVVNVSRIVRFKRFAKAKPISKNATEVTCKICGKRYVNEEECCPYCGAKENLFDTAE